MCIGKCQPAIYEAARIFQRFIENDSERSLARSSDPFITLRYDQLYASTHICLCKIDLKNLP